MPTLAPEPPTAPTLDLRAVPGTWSVAQVKTQEEHAVARRVAAFGIATYLPCVAVTRIYAKRKVVVQQPVFRGYLCVAWQEDLQRGDILCARGVYGLKRVLDQSRFVADLENIQAAITANPSLEIVEDIPAGRKVRVVRGPFVGTVGVYEERHERGALLIGSIVMPGGLLLEVDYRDLEPV